MKNFNEEDFPIESITMEPWMRFELGLTGSDLTLYAFIYACTMAFGCYTGTKSSLGWIGWSRNTLYKHLNALVGRGLLTVTRHTECGWPVTCIAARKEAYLKAMAAYGSGNPDQPKDIRFSWF